MWLLTSPFPPACAQSVSLWGFCQSLRKNGCLAVEENDLINRSFGRFRSFGEVWLSKRQSALLITVLFRITLARTIRLHYHKLSVSKWKINYLISRSGQKNTCSNVWSFENRSTLTIDFKFDCCVISSRTFKFHFHLQFTLVSSPLLGFSFILLLH